MPPRAANSEQRVNFHQWTPHFHQPRVTSISTPAAHERVDIVIMNPPFSLAQEFVSRCHEHIKPRGTIAALLRLAFVCSKKRADFRRCFPCGVYPLASRPSFTGDGKSDSSDYAWMLFGAEHAGKYRTLEVEKP